METYNRLQMTSIGAFFFEKAIVHIECNCDAITRRAVLESPILCEIRVCIYVLLSGNQRVAMAVTLALYVNTKYVVYIVLGN